MGNWKRRVRQVLNPKEFKCPNLPSTPEVWRKMYFFPIPCMATNIEDSLVDVIHGIKSVIQAIFNPLRRVFGIGPIREIGRRFSIAIQNGVRNEIKKDQENNDN